MNIFEYLLHFISKSFYQVTGCVKGKFGKPGEVVVSIAHEEHAEMIICGNRGQGKVRRTFMGSVSDYIVHHSDVPVVVCRHKSHHHHWRRSTIILLKHFIFFISVLYNKNQKCAYFTCFMKKFDRQVFLDYTTVSWLLYSIVFSLPQIIKYD